MLTSRRWFWTFVALVGMTVALAAQTPKPASGVVSVKRETRDRLGSGVMVVSGDSFTATNVPLVRVIAFAYAVAVYQVIGGPDWIRTDRFDIVAKADRDVPPDQRRLMVQTLLEDRFRLAVRRERRDIPVFFLRRVLSDGRLGPGLERAPDNCGTPSVRLAPDGRYLGGADCQTITTFAASAEIWLRVPVRDDTTLTGKWNYTFSTPPQPNSDVTAYSAAMSEQLGLKLERGNAPADVLVIDSVQQPTPN